MKLCKLKILLLTATVLLSCFGCGSSGEQGKTAENDESIIDLMKGMRQGEVIEARTEETVQGETEEVSALDTEAFCVNATDFAITLLRENMQASEENVLLSPISLLNVIAMLANGAKEETRTQMLSVLADGQDAESLNRNMKAWMENLSSVEDVRMQIANSLWIHEDAEHFAVEESFLKQNVLYYDTDIYQAPFTKNTESVMNRWVSDRTDGEIGNLIEDLSEDAVMTLIDTVTFDARWQRVYDEYEVKDSYFINASGEKENVSMMYAAEYAYIEDENATGFIKPYQNGYSFVAILPNEGMTPADYIQTLDGEHFLAMLTDADLSDDARLETGMPKFKAEYNAKLSEELKNMGMINAFDASAADFSGLGNIVDGRNLYIDAIWHKTCITVDELGTKARAATAEGAVATADEAEMNILRVYLNRPFIYAIIDDQNHIPIFIGVINNINPS